MITKEILKKIVILQKEELSKKETGIKRENSEIIDLKLPHAFILSGIRRCGKSTLLRQLMLKTKGIYYFNFEDSKSFNFEATDFEKLNEVFKEEFGESNYYFFDEIQNVPNWEIFVRRLLDDNKKCIITGSNASLLSRELGTKLTGRHITYELFPFSYKEMLEFTRQKNTVSSAEYYLQNGGFPEFLQFKRSDILQELLYDILARDIIVRHGLRETKILKEILIYLLSNSGKEFSYNKLANIFKLGSVSTVISYISYFEDSYLLFTIPKFDFSYKKQIVNPKKIYCIDNGFTNANTVSFSEDKGKALENTVFLSLRRMYKEIYYFKEKYECDFIIKYKGKLTQAIQVCLEINEDNRLRELNGLEEAMDKLKINNGVIITLNQEDKLGDIDLIPIWKWLS